MSDDVYYLKNYAEDQGTVEDRAASTLGEPPWPEKGSEMMRYLIERATRTADDDGLEVALVWLAAHAWFEGGMAERGRRAASHDEA